MHIANKVAFITGGAGGIGRAFCRALLQRGAKVSIVDFDSTTGLKVLDELKSEYGKDKAMFIQCNVAKTKDLENAFNATVEKFGGVDIVCNNAGIGEREPTGWETVVEINLTAVIAGTRLAVNHMKAAKKGGVIVNTASMGGLVPMPFAPVYSASKAGVVYYSRSLGYLSKHGIRVNAICPSFTDTAMVAEGFEHSPVFKDVVEATGPLLSPELIAQGLVQLVEDDSKAGEVMRVTHAKGIDFQSYGGFAKRQEQGGGGNKSKL